MSEKQQKQQKAGKKQQKAGKKQQKQQGGSTDAASYALAVYGAGDAQHAAVGQGNTIAMNYVANGGRKRQVKSARRGGKKQQQQKQDGGSILQDIAVPALMLYANQAFGRSHTAHKKRGSMNRRTHRRR